MEKCFKVLNDKGQTMTPCGKWWYDEQSLKFDDQPEDVKYNTDTFYTDTVNNAFSSVEGNSKGHYYIVECESDGRGDVKPTDNQIKCYYNGGKITYEGS
tara:strand:- start:40 stop:336 length:297 start_codon:yes stop_codon:yes gene_type:complete